MDKSESAADFAGRRMSESRDGGDVAVLATILTSQPTARTY